MFLWVRGRTRGLGAGGCTPPDILYPSSNFVLCLLCNHFFGGYTPSCVPLSPYFFIYIYLLIKKGIFLNSKFPQLITNDSFLLLYTHLQEISEDMKTTRIFKAPSFLEVTDISHYFMKYHKGECFFRDGCRTFGCSPQMIKKYTHNEGKYWMIWSFGLVRGCTTDTLHAGKM